MRPSSSPSLVQLRFDCELCGVEGAGVETFDPVAVVCRFGVPVSASCRLCGQEARGIAAGPVARGETAAVGCPFCAASLDFEGVGTQGCADCGASARMEIVRRGVVPATSEDLERAVAQWAHLEGFDDVEAFVAATFVRPSMSDLLGALAAGELVETVPDLFARAGEGGTMTLRSPAAPRRPLGLLALDEAAASKGTATSSAAIASSPSPRAVLYPLASVVAADGEIHPRERELVDRFLQAEGLAQIAEEELQVHRPDDVAQLVPLGRREPLLQLMCELASIDGAADASEIRVIRAYAAAWNVPADKVDLWIWAHENMGEPFLRLFWKRVRRFVLASRWDRDRDHELDGDRGAHAGVGAASALSSMRPRGTSR